VSNTYFGGRPIFGDVRLSDKKKFALVVTFPTSSFESNETSTMAPAAGSGVPPPSG